MPPQLPPATPGGPTPFGTSVQSSATKDNGGKKEMKRKEAEAGGALAFLNDTVCVVCNEGIVTGAQKGRIYYMTSCGHIICNKPEHDNKHNICTACGKPMTAKQIDEENLPSDLKRWFCDPQYELNEIYTEQQKLHTEQQKLQLEQLKLAKRLNGAREVVKAETARLRSEMEGLLKENETLKAKLAAAQSAQPSQHNQQPLHGLHRSNGTYGANHGQRNARGNLPTVQEEGDYDVEGGYSGEIVGTANKGDAMRAILGKRYADESFEEQPNRLPPSTPIGRVGAMGGPAHPPSNSGIYPNDVMSTPRRPMSAGGYRGNQLSRITNQLNLESYRMDAHQFTPRQYRPDPQDRSMTPLQRASSARPYVHESSGQMLPPSAYQQGLHQGNQQGVYENQPGSYEYNERYQTQNQYGMDQHDDNQYRENVPDENTRSAPGRPAGNGFSLASRPTTRVPPPF
ncbi:hypothetical protein IAT40_003118 [Kwoniella sp. CBS 6097]